MYGQAMLPPTLHSSDIYGQMVDVGNPMGTSFTDLSTPGANRLPNVQIGTSPPQISASGGVSVGVSSGAAYWFLLLLGLLVLGRVLYEVAD